MGTVLTLLFGIVFGMAIAFCIWKRKQKKKITGIFGRDPLNEYRDEKGKVD